MRGPRPLPLFLELVRGTASREPELARGALDGLRRYQDSAGVRIALDRPVAAEIGSTTLRDCGGGGRMLVLVPSLINPPGILDLDPDCSLAEALAKRNRVLLLDWGAAADRKSFDLDDHINERLLPLIEPLGPVTLVGYCLGGTLALAAAAKSQAVEAVVTLASPWTFDSYPGESTEQLVRLWRACQAAAVGLGFLPMEVMQAAFWRIDPARLVAKFARFATMPEGSAEARRFVALEDWANGGEPLPLPTARQLVEQLFEGAATLGPLPTCPMLHVTAAADRIVPAATVAPEGDRLSSVSGHVGMIVGRDAAAQLHQPLLSWLEAPGARR